MARHTLYAYVEGCDFHDIAGELESRFERFVEEGTWRSNKPEIVNEQFPPEPGSRPGELPQWDLGLNLDLPDTGAEPPDWFSDIEQILRFLGELNAKIFRNSVVGVVDNVRHLGEDLFYIDSPAPDFREARFWLLGEAPPPR